MQETTIAIKVGVARTPACDKFATPTVTQRKKNKGLHKDQKDYKKI